MCEGWLDEMDADDNWHEDEYEVNSPIVEGWFTDSNLDSNGNDTSHLDAADAAMVAWHGGNYYTGRDYRYRGIMRVEETPYGSETCTLTQEEILLGGDQANRDLEFFHLSSCHSLEWRSSATDTWETWKQSFTSTSYTAGLHQLQGFHGTMRIHASHAIAYEHFAEDGLEDSIAEAWVDHLYRNPRGENNDQCPVSMVAGSTAEFAAMRLAYEDYNDGWSDPDDTPGFAYIWVGYCDPDPEEVDNLPVYP